MFPAARPGFELWIDTSVAQGELDVSSLPPHVAGVIARVCEGHSLDAQWRATLAACQAAGKPLGAYAVIDPGADPASQAQVAVVELAGFDFACVAMDWEWAKGERAADAILRADVYADALEQGLGRAVEVYTATGFVGGLVHMASPLSADVQAALARLGARGLWQAFWPTLNWDRPDLHPWPSTFAPFTAPAKRWQSTGGKATLPNGRAVDVSWQRCDHVDIDETPTPRTSGEAP